MLVGRQWKVGLGGGPGVCGELACASARHSPPASRWGPCRSALGMWPSPGRLCKSNEAPPLVKTSDGSPSIYPCPDLVMLIWAPAARWTYVMRINGNRVKAVACGF